MAESTTGSLFGLLLVFAIFGLAVAAAVYSVLQHAKAVERRDQMLRKKFGDDIQIERSFPLNQASEDIVQGGIAGVFQDFRELITGKTWVFIQFSSKIPVLTRTEDRGFNAFGLFAQELEEFTPFIVIKNKKNKSLYSRAMQASVDKGELVWCEGVFDAAHNIYNEPDGQLDTLSILSPEVLEVIQDPPGDADIILKRNQLYYVFGGKYSAEDILDDLFVHSRTLAAALEENLARWGRAESNRQKLASIINTELAVTLREAYERRLNA